MKLMQKAAAYLNSTAYVVDSLSEISCSDDLIGQPDTLHKVVITMLELEQSTADLINDLEFDNIAPNEVKASKQRFISSNERTVVHLEKIQSQGYNFSELVTALKLENDTLKEEIRFT